MTKIKVGGAAALVMAAWTVVLTPGLASADDYAGQKYSDVMSKLGAANLKGVIATRAGDQLSDDDCIVTSSEKAPWIKGNKLRKFAAVTDTVLLNLNCNATVASAGTSGNSQGSPEGRAAIAQAQQQAQQAQAQAAADQNKNRR